MKSAPLNYLVTLVLGGLLWAVFAIFLVGTLTEGPSLAIKAPEDLADQLRTVFGVGALLSVGLASYWYFYGSQPATATRLTEARGKYTQFFLTLVFIAVGLTAVLWYINRAEGMEPKWFAIYFGINLVLTAVLYWLATFLFSPRAVENVPYAK
jgi:hypothetical protein